jgi:UMF1 family MFS transporter
VGNEISIKAFFYGYLAAVGELIIAAAFVVYAKGNNNLGFSETYPMQISTAAICVWQLFIILRYTQQLMKTRPGPPLPKGENYISFSVKNLITTCRQAYRLTQLFKFFLLGSSIQTVSQLQFLLPFSLLNLNWERIQLFYWLRQLLLLRCL